MNLAKMGPFGLTARSGRPSQKSKASFRLWTEMLGSQLFQTIGCGFCFFFNLINVEVKEDNSERISRLLYV